MTVCPVVRWRTMPRAVDCRAYHHFALICRSSVTPWDRKRKKKRRCARRESYIRARRLFCIRLRVPRGQTPRILRLVVRPFGRLFVIVSSPAARGRGISHRISSHTQPAPSATYFPSGRRRRDAGVVKMPGRRTIMYTTMTRIRIQIALRFPNINVKYHNPERNGGDKKK